MGEPKTKPTDASVDDFIAALPDARKQADSRELVRIMSEVTGHPPVMWSSIIGFGTMHYVYASGRSGDWPSVAFSPRKAAISLYLSMNDDTAARDEILARLGKHTMGKGCIYVKKLGDVDSAVLRELIQWSHDANAATTS